MAELGLSQNLEDSKILESPKAEDNQKEDDDLKNKDEPKKASKKHGIPPTLSVSSDYSSILCKLGI